MEGENPDLHIDELNIVFACDFSLEIELLKPLCIQVSVRDHRVMEVCDRFHCFPYFDEAGNLFYTQSIDKRGFATPEMLAQHCVLWLLTKTKEGGADQQNFD